MSAVHSEPQDPLDSHGLRDDGGSPLDCGMSLKHEGDSSTKDTNRYRITRWHRRKRTVYPSRFKSMTTRNKNPCTRDCRLCDLAHRDFRLARWKLGVTLTCAADEDIRELVPRWLPSLHSSTVWRLHYERHGSGALHAHMILDRHITYAGLRVALLRWPGSAHIHRLYGPFGWLHYMYKDVGGEPLVSANYSRLIPLPPYLPLTPDDRRLGGRRGGLARRRALSAIRRAEIARQAAQARWRRSRRRRR